MAGRLDNPGPQPRGDAPHERPADPCRQAYTKLRTRILGALTQPKQRRLSSAIQSTARTIFLVLDVIARWVMDIVDTVIGNRGYVGIGTVVAAYFAIFGLIDAKSTQE